MFPHPFKKRQEAIADTLLQIKYSEHLETGSMKLMAALVHAIRPKTALRIQFAEEQIVFLMKCLRTDEVALQKTKQSLFYLFSHSDVSEVMTESGLITETGFFSELSRRFNSKILPPLKNTGSFIYAVDSLFYKSSDYKWVNGVDNNLWMELFDLLGIHLNISDESLRTQLVNSIDALSYRVAMFGMEKTIVEHAGKGLGGIGSPFVGQNRILNDFRFGLDGNHPEKWEQFKQAYVPELERCGEVLNLLKRKRVIQGVSIRQTYSMLQLEQLIERIRLLIDFADNNRRINIKRFVALFKTVIENENTKTSLRRYIGKNVELLAYQIAEHERNTGEHYITATKEEYAGMFRSAAGGGVIVGFLAVFKLLLHYLPAAPFWQAFLYSINYAAGFILIQVAGCTLATKQPSMTASTIASSLDEKKIGAPNLPQLAITVSRAVRSQAIAFAGNLIVAFPVALAIAAICSFVFKHPLANPEHARLLLDEINPAKHACYLYAAIAGVFLFLSGLISGYVDNRVRYGKIPQRVKAHPFLRLTFSGHTLDKIAAFVDKNMGLITGNLVFGICMGMASFFGYIFGLPIDIRHVTFSTANLAIGLWGTGFHLPLTEWVQVLSGIALIGLVNFAVSFALAFYVAVKSRGIYVKQYGRIFHYLRVMLKKYPMDFIRPPGKARVPEDIMYG
jgi:site-specific recombinase